MDTKSNDYAKWSEPELRRAESVANQFLQDHAEQIRQNFELKIARLQQLVESLDRHMNFDQRLDCFARIAEAARSLEEDAVGFFGMAAEPVVARLLAKVESKRRR